eukprot:gene15061-16616_t
MSLQRSPRILHGGQEDDQVGGAEQAGDAERVGDADQAGDVERVGDAELVGDEEQLGDAELVGDVERASDAELVGDEELVGDAEQLGDAELVGDAEHHLEEELVRSDQMAAVFQGVCHSLTRKRSHQPKSKSRLGCDNAFLSAMLRTCRARAKSVWGKLNYTQCVKYAGVYYAAVRDVTGQYDEKELFWSFNSCLLVFNYGFKRSDENSAIL